MAVRLSMATLIDKVNALCNNALNENLRFANQDVQDCLDRHRREYRETQLEALATTGYGGTVTCKTFQAECGMIEGGTAYLGGSAGYLLQDGNFGTVTPSSSDLLTGRFLFATEPTRPVMLTGWYYDIYGAAAELLLQYKATISEDFDFKSGEGLTYSRSQKMEMVEKHRQTLLRQAWAPSATMVRTDVGH